MSTQRPRAEQPKTECWFCGNVWQEHTLNELGGCMAIMHLRSFVLARSSRQEDKAFLERRPVEPCPVCNKLPAEHTDDDLTSCMAKWRKRERGSTGLELQRMFIETHAEARGQNEETDPVKIAQLQARWMQALCPCGKAYGDHTQDELRACFDRKTK